MSDQEGGVEGTAEDQPSQPHVFATSPRPWTEGDVIQAIWWFAADPEYDIRAFWTVRGVGDTWADDPTVFKIDVAM